MLAYSLIRQQKPNPRVKTDFEHDRKHLHLLLSSEIFNKDLYYVPGSIPEKSSLNNDD